MASREVNVKPIYIHGSGPGVCLCECVCVRVCACMRAGVCARVRACVRVRVCMYLCESLCSSPGPT